MRLWIGFALSLLTAPESILADGQGSGTAVRVRADGI